MQRPAQRNKRARARIEVRYGPDEPCHLGYSRNVSPTGLMVASTRVFAPGTTLQLSLRLGCGTFRLVGQVVWARKGPIHWLSTGRIGMGITFIDPPREFLEAIPAA